MRPEDVPQAIARSVQSFFIGQEATLELLVGALGARAHVLLEGPPGTAKTLVAWAMAKSVGLAFKRVQLTPDLMPGDLLGTSVWIPHEGRFQFHRGPVFTDVLLADELNRAPPKTQAALLEAMQERQVTYDGVTMPLGDAFWVIATQNPLEHEGTYPLPESQLDRFALRITMGYPTAAEERAILVAHRGTEDPFQRLRDLDEPAVRAPDLRAWQDLVRRIHVDDTIIDYIRALTVLSRAQPELATGASPRAGVALVRLGQALASVRRRRYVVPDDIRDLAAAVLVHRLRLTPEAQIAGLSASAVLGRLLATTPVPAARAEVVTGDRALS